MVKVEEYVIVAQGLCIEDVDVALADDDDNDGFAVEICEEQVAEDERLSREEDIVKISDLPSLKSDYLVMKYDNL